ncbi:dihydroxyacetone kinase subunit DhaL [Pleomorphomonas koreensis]|uniref:dihydroxyacetone kinase subunit DhaL n=1 Tax=Pleomorphomonas koreensis TaxID=257440 RepID=UPI000406C568|nr:dihydroxyacetone kinase subunit DhaL [Pleomorphomonas koreensis]
MGLQVNDAGFVVTDLIKAIVAQRDRLSEIDGAIGDGDHGVNMAKGFNLCAQALGTPTPGLKESLATLGNTLMAGIGGSMGPLYGTFFNEMADSLDGVTELDAPAFARMVRAGLDGVLDIGGAKPGDKTLLDTLVPAVEAFEAALAAGKPYKVALDDMTEAARQGRDSTVGMIARVGRASRLGERSRGVLDAGSASCCVILETMAGSVAPKVA